MSARHSILNFGDYDLKLNKYTCASQAYHTLLILIRSYMVHSQAPGIRLVSHPIGRNAAVARSLLRSGTTITCTLPLATSLLPSEKSKRCDSCHCLQSEAVSLKRCSGCASVWYCGTTCAKISHLTPFARSSGVEVRSESGVELPSQEDMQELQWLRRLKSVPSPDRPRPSRRAPPFPAPRRPVRMERRCSC